MPPRTTKRTQSEADAAKAAGATGLPAKAARLHEEGNEHVPATQDGNEDEEANVTLPVFTPNPQNATAEQVATPRTAPQHYTPPPATPSTGSASSGSRVSAQIGSLDKVELYLSTTAGPPTASQAAGSQAAGSQASGSQAAAESISPSPSRLMNNITTEHGCFVVGVINNPVVPRNQFLGAVMLTPLLSALIEAYEHVSALGCYATFENVEKLAQLPVSFGFLRKTFGPIRCLAFRATNNTRVVFREAKELPTFMPAANGIREGVKDPKDWVMPQRGAFSLPEADPRCYIVIPYREYENGALHKYEAKMLCQNGMWGEVDLVLNTARSSFKYPAYLDNALRNATLNADLLVVAGKHPQISKSGFKSSIYIDASVLARLDKNNKEYKGWKAAAHAPPPVVGNFLSFGGLAPTPTSLRTSHWEKVADGLLGDAPSLPNGACARVRLHVLPLDDRAFNDAALLAINFTRNGRWHAAFISDGTVLAGIPDVEALGVVANGRVVLDEFSIALLVDELQEPFVANISVKAAGSLLEICRVECVDEGAAEEDAAQFAA